MDLWGDSSGQVWIIVWNLGSSVGVIIHLVGVFLFFSEYLLLLCIYVMGEACRCVIFF
jgi:hypothetical protein